MKQKFDLIDYFGPLAVAALFAVILFISCIIINFFWITKEDDRTVFEEMGSSVDVRFGVHRMRHRPDQSRKKQLLITT